MIQPYRTLRKRELLVPLCLLLFALALLVGGFFYVWQRFLSPRPILSAEELHTRVEAGYPNGADTVTEALLGWGFPRFHSGKLLTVEQCFQQNYFYQDRLQDKELLAEATARCFLSDHYAAIDLSSSAAVTDALLRSYVYVVGDRYTIYRSAAEEAVYEDSMAGAFTGIGVVVTYESGEGALQITSVNADGPAEQAGLRVGDAIVAVDGQTVASLGYEGALAAVRGDAGTAVVITVRRAGALSDYTVLRAPVEDQSVIYSLDRDGIAYLRITKFNKNTDEQFIGAVDALISAGAKALLFDVRSNPGGYLDSVVRAVDYLVADGETIVSFSRGEPILGSDGHSVKLPMAVLTDGYTASAGELFAACLRDYETYHGLWVHHAGTVTYGKGVMQQTYSLSDGSAVTLTVAQYNPPSGINYDGVGLVPEELIPPEQGAEAPMLAAKEKLLSEIKQ